MVAGLLQSCRPWWVEKKKKDPKNKTSVAVMSWGNGLSTECVLTGKCVKRCVSKSLPSQWDNWNQRWVGSMCERGLFVSLITLSLPCVFHCSPRMNVTFCCPVKGNQYLEWADGSQWDCSSFPLRKGLCVNTYSKKCNVIFRVKEKCVSWDAKDATL